MKQVKVGDKKGGAILPEEISVNPELELLIINNPLAVKELSNNVIWKHLVKKVDDVEKEMTEQVLSHTEMSSVQYYRGGVWTLRELKKNILELINKK